MQRSFHTLLSVTDIPSLEAYTAYTLLYLRWSEYDPVLVAVLAPGTRAC